MTDTDVVIELPIAGEAKDFDYEGDVGDAIYTMLELTDEAAGGLVEMAKADFGTETAGYDALVRAVSQIGVRETPYNCQPYSRWFGVSCAPWCAYFISWCFDTSVSGNKDHRVPWPAGSSEGIYNWGRAHSLLVSAPRTGDICIYPNFSHSCIVRGVDSTTGAFNTVDGNWSDKVSYVVGLRNFRSQRYFFVRVVSPV